MNWKYISCVSACWGGEKIVPKPRGRIYSISPAL